MTGVNGALPAAQVIAESWREHAGGTAEVDEHMRLHVLGELVGAAGPARAAAGRDRGRRRRCAWSGSRSSTAAAAEQAGRPHAPRRTSTSTSSSIDGKIAGQEIWLWEDAGRRGRAPDRAQPAVVRRRAGRPGLHADGAPRPRVRQRRGGRACPGCCCDRGAEVCLFTDQANPTSNKIYAAIGYEPVVDMANLAVDHHTSTGLTTLPDAESAIAWLIWSNG